MAIEIFISYAHEDRAFREELDKHLSNLRRQKIISDWYDGDIIPGTEWKPQIMEHLNSSQIILLLISADFLNSDFCYSIEMTQAIERHNAGQARVIPIILRPVDWKDAPFAKLDVLPQDGKPVTRWPTHDDAFFDVATGIRQAVDDLSKNIETIPQINSRQAASPPLDERINLLETDEFDDEIIDPVREELDRRLKADQSQMLPMDTKKQLFLALRQLFNRKTFNEKVEDCVDQNWGGRLRAASLTKRVLRDYLKYISQFGAPEYPLYEQLITEVDAYCMGLMGLFKPYHLLDDIEKYIYNAEEFKNHLPDRLLKPDIPTEYIARCDNHLKRIHELVHQLTDDYV